LLCVSGPGMSKQLGLLLDTLRLDTKQLVSISHAAAMVADGTGVDSVMGLMGIKLEQAEIDLC
jgi:hypothetical protein